MTVASFLNTPHSRSALRTVCADHLRIGDYLLDDSEVIQRIIGPSADNVLGVIFVDGNCHHFRGDALITIIR